MRSSVSMVLAAVVAVGLSVVVADVEAKRLGGGKSVGRQSSGVTQRDAAPPAAAPGAGSQAAPTQNVAPAQAARPATPAPAAPAAPPARNRWLAPLAGIAAGLGLAALASHFGFGDGLASLMLVALLAVAAVFVVRMFLARRSAAAAGARGPFAYSPVGGQGGGAAPAWQQAEPPRSEPHLAGAALAPVAAQDSGMRVPAGFDSAGFVAQAKQQFVRMQTAFDAGNLDQLREFTSPAMFDQLRSDIDERGGAPNRTDVVTLEAELLGIESDASEHVASVRFHGMTREAANAAAEPFDEVWNLTKPADGSSGWVLAGVQQLT